MATSSTAEIPSAIEEVTAPWLSGVLGGTVAAARAERIAEPHAFAVLPRVRVVQRELAREYARPDHRRGETRSLFIRP